MSKEVEHKEAKQWTPI